MPFVFYLAIFFMLIALIPLLIGKVTVDRGLRTENVVSVRPFGFAVLMVSLLLVLLSSTTVVGARNVGVEKFFSATTGRTLDAGFHFKAPWHSVQDIDATIQAEEYSTKDPILVKIGDQGEAKVALAYRWRINPDGAPDIYKDYRKADDINQAVRKALVSTNIKAALNEELSAYNPLEGVQINASMSPSEIAKVTIPPIPYAELNEAVKKNLEAKIDNLGDLIEIQSVTISYIQLPESTQKKINEFNTKVQSSKNALIDIAIKAAQSSANEKLSKSVDDSPNVLVSKCLDALAEGEFTAPAGFSCWPGGGGSVVIPSGK